MKENIGDLWNGGASDRWTLFLVFLTQLLMFPTTYLCIRRILVGAWNWYNLWNMIDTCIQAIQVATTVCYLTGVESMSVDIMIASQVVLLVAKIQFFAR